MATWRVQSKCAVQAARRACRSLHTARSRQGLISGARWVPARKRPATIPQGYRACGPTFHGRVASCRIATRLGCAPRQQQVRGVQLYEGPKKWTKKPKLYETDPDPDELEKGGNAASNFFRAIRIREKHFPIKRFMNTFDKGSEKIDPVQFRLFNAKEAQVVPDMQVCDATSEGELKKDFLKGHVSLVSFMLSAYAAQISKNWTVPFLEFFKEEEEVKCFEVSVITGLMALGPLRTLSKKAVAGQYKDELEGVGLTSFNFSKEHKQAFGVYNPRSTYVFLLDKHGRIRWRGSGAPEDSELPMLVRFTQTLVDEL